MYQQHQRLSIDYSAFPVYSLPFGLHVRSLLCANLNSPTLISSTFKVLRILDFYPSMDYHDVIGIENLIYLRYLAFSLLPPRTQLPPMESFCKLEFLDVDNFYKVEIPENLLKMVTPRQVYFRGGAYFSLSCRQQASQDETFQINNNLQCISAVSISDETDEKILRCLPNLRRLKGKVVSSLNYSFNLFNQLESLKLLPDDDDDDDDSCSSLINFSLPSSLRKLTLVDVSVSREQMEIIGSLQYLEGLKLEEAAFEGGQWDISQDEFPQLKFLKLDDVQLEEWNASSDDFPSLERLVLQYCKHLKMIPSCLGDIATLQMIEVYACSQDVKESAKQIQEEQEDNGNEVLKFIIPQY